MSAFRTLSLSTVNYQLKAVKYFFEETPLFNFQSVNLIFIINTVKLQMGQSIQAWTKKNLWKTAFKKFDLVM